MKVEDREFVEMTRVRWGNKFFLSLGLPLYFIFNTWLNWDDFGEKGAWSISAIAGLIICLQIGYAWEVKRLLKIIDATESEDLDEAR